MIAYRLPKFAIRVIIYMQIAMGVGVKMYLGYIERMLKQLTYFNDTILRHVGYHSLSIKVA